MYQILAGRALGATVAELAAALDVSARTIDRDIEALSEVVGLRRCACRGARGVRLDNHQSPWLDPL
jgi:predicted DNA-binding transcriptional regulator YafY